MAMDDRVGQAGAKTEEGLADPHQMLIGLGVQRDLRIDPGVDEKIIRTEPGCDRQGVEERDMMRRAPGNSLPVR